MNTPIFVQNYLASLPSLTIPHFLQTWLMLSLVSVLLLSNNNYRHLRVMLWLAIWIVATPLRPAGEDVLRMIPCLVFSEVTFTFFMFAKPNQTQETTEEQQNAGN